jgi:tetratricopeptide (TPR) repeat protein
MKYYPNSQIYKIVNVSHFFLILFLWVSISASQFRNREFDYAQILERNESYEQALKIYKNLYIQDPSNTIVIDAIVRCRFALNQYDDLVSFLKEVRIRNENNFKIDWSIELAEAYFLNNQKEEALLTWRSLIEENNDEKEIYRAVAESMVNLRLFNEAIGIYLNALKDSRDSYYLHIGIGNLYKAIFEFGKAAEHYLAYFSYFPDSKLMLQRHILSLTSKDEEIAPVIASLESYINEHSENNIVKEILAGLYIKYRHFDKAYEIYQSLGKKDMKGKYLFDFALVAFNNSAFIFSMKAYQDLINNFPESRFLEQAKFGIGKCHNALAYEYRKESEEKKAIFEMNKAISIFDTLTLNYKNPNIGQECYFELGTIYYRFFYDLDKAIQYYKKLLINFPFSGLKEKVTIILGDIYLIKGNMVSAKETYQSCLNNSYLGFALFKLAELDFFQGDFQPALIKYSQVISKSGINDSLTNNVLSRKLLIHSFMEDTIGLKKYANAERLIFQNRLSEAVEQLIELVNRKMKLSLTAGRKASEILIKMGKLLQAKELLNDLIKEYKESEYIDRLIFLLAYSEEKSGNLINAHNLYKLLLSDYPNSLMIQEARDNARILSEKLKEKQL